MKRSNRDKSCKFKFSFVMPVYNVEGYLDDAVRCILNQTMDFRKNCEIIFINDGSDDKTEQICKKYQRQFPRNIKYLKQRNQGPEVARNLGVTKCEGKYVSFFDSDDLISDDTLAEVYSFFEKHYDQVDFVSIKLEFFGSREGAHPLNYKFTDDRVIDIRDEFRSIQTTCGSTFVKNEVFSGRGWRFNRSALNVADAEFFTKLVLDKMAYGVVVKPTYYYRQRQDSLTKVEQLRKSFYLEQTKEGYLSILNYASKKMGYVPEYCQWVVLYYLRLHVQSPAKFLLTADEYEEYKTIINKILQYIEDRVVLDKSNGISTKRSVYLLSIKYGDDTTAQIRMGTDGMVLWRDIPLYRTRNIKTMIQKIQIVDDQLVIVGFHTGYMVGGLNVYLKSGNKVFQAQYDEERNPEVLCFGDTAHKQNAFTIRIQLDTHTSMITLHFYAKVDSVEYRLWNIAVNDASGISFEKDWGYIHLGNHDVVWKGDSLVVQKRSVRESAKRGLKYARHVYRKQGIGPALVAPLEHIRRTTPLGAPINFINTLINPGQKLVSREAAMRYGELFEPPQHKEFRLGVRRNQRSIRIAAIMDDFTYSSFKHECNILQISPIDWKKTIRDFRPDILFIESAWRGKDSLWKSRVDRVSYELESLVRYCKDNDIPTVFWNKEDPVHTLHFLRAASLCDYIFTTDSDSIDVYRRILGRDHIFLLPFAVQQRDHNPIEKYKRQDKFNFAGSYYREYEERCRDFRSIVSAVTKIKGLDIYDRNYNTGRNRFSKEYTKYVKGSLPFSEIDKAYKGYRYAITMNTVKHSSTMFARRALELLASNTITVGNYSEGVIRTLGDLTIASDNADAILKRLEEVTRDRYTENAYRLAGLRKVLLEHSYTERLNRVLRVVFSDSEKNLIQERPSVAYVGYAKNEADAASLLEAFNRQITKADRELIICGFNPVGTDKRLMAIKEIKKRSLTKLIGKGSHVLTFNPQSYYGRQYATDLILTTLYSDAEVIGKSAYYDISGNKTRKLKLKNDGSQYRENIPIRSDRGLLSASFVERQTVAWLVEVTKSPHIYRRNTLSIDEFNYTPRGNTVKDSDYDMIDARINIDSGAPVTDLYSIADHASNDARRNLAAIMRRRLHIIQTFPAKENY